jgi:acetyl esterase/lipase
MYPVNLMEDPAAHRGSRDNLLGTDQSRARRDAYTPSLHVRPDTPPTWMTHCADDTSVPLANGLAMFTALQAAGVTSELHVWEEGGHGHGVRLAQGKPVAAWLDLYVAWARRHGWFTTA